MVAKYDFKSEKTRLLKILRMSIRQKKKKGWSENIGVGFIADDLKEVKLDDDKNITLISEGFKQTLKVSDLNLRETKELLKFVENEEFYKDKMLSKPIAFRISDEDYDKVIDILSELKRRTFVGLGINRSKFFRAVFKEGLRIFESRLNGKNVCSKCGKRLPITVPRHLRNRVEVCDCDTYQSVSFVVNSKDLFDKKKNPNLSLSPKDILKNDKIPKKKGEPK